MDIDQLLSTALAIVSLTTLAGMGLMRGSLTGLRDSNGDLRNRVGDLEKERAEDRAKLSELEGENRLLQVMVTGKVDWGAISDLLEEHHRQALKQWRALDDKLNRMLAKGSE